MAGARMYLCRSAEGKVIHPTSGPLASHGSLRGSSTTSLASSGVPRMRPRCRSSTSSSESRVMRAQASRSCGGIRPTVGPPNCAPSPPTCGSRSSVGVAASSRELSESGARQFIADPAASASRVAPSFEPIRGRHDLVDEPRQPVRRSEAASPSCCGCEGLEGWRWRCGPSSQFSAP